MHPLQYPIGTFTASDRTFTESERAAFIARIERIPSAVRDAVAGLTDEQLDTPYRDGGWTPRQIVHHMADSHMNGFVRLKLALTEDTPTVRPYEQDGWSEQYDVIGVTVEASLAILDGLHARWVSVLRAMTPEQFGRKLYHPEDGEMDLDCLLETYAWHGDHHLGQLTGLRAQQGW